MCHLTMSVIDHRCLLTPRNPLPLVGEIIRTRVSPAYVDGIAYDLSLLYSVLFPMLGGSANWLACRLTDKLW